MIFVSVAVEGPSDVAPAETLLASCGATLAPGRTFIKRGKANLDGSLQNYNRAAELAPWFVLRDSDHDYQDCPVATREALLPKAIQSNGMFFRLAVHSVEAWLLGDSEQVARFFSIPESQIAQSPDQLENPKRHLVELCSRSRSAGIRQAMVPRPRSVVPVGREYVAFISEFARTTWCPSVAAERSPSLARAVADIRRMVESGNWV